MQTPIPTPALAVSRRAHRLALLAGLVASLYACGGGGGEGDPVAAPTPAPQQYSAVYFTDKDSTVAFVESVPDGTGFVGYRDAAGLVSHVDYLARDKTIYHFSWPAENEMVVQFDGLTMAMDLRGQLRYYAPVGRDGSTVTGSLPTEKSLQKWGIFGKKCLDANPVAESEKPIWGKVIDYKCSVAELMAEATPAAEFFEYLVGKGARQVERLGEAGTAFLQKGKIFFASNELPGAAQRLVSLPRQELGSSNQVVKTPVLADGRYSAHLPGDQVSETITNMHKPPSGTGVMDWTQVKPVGTGMGTAPSPAPDSGTAPASVYAGTYQISGGGVNLTFPVNANGNIDKCSAGMLITCSGKVASSGDFTLKGSDGDGTNATLNGKIDGSGRVTGSYTGTSDGQAISGNFTGSRSGVGNEPPISKPNTNVQGGLIWSQPTTGAREYTAAKAYCDGMGTGWRLPSIQELKNLYDSGAYKGMWNVAVFYVYSSTPNTVVPPGQYGYGKPAIYSFEPGDVGNRLSWDTGYGLPVQAVCVRSA